MTSHAKFEEWALLELFGHNKIAGRVSESEIAGGKFIRVDVPELDGAQAVTRYYTPAAIYGITPLSEETCLGIARGLKVMPVARWDVREMLAREKEQLALARRSRGDEEDFDA